MKSLHAAFLVLLVFATSADVFAQDLKDLARRAGASVVHLDVIGLTGQTVGNGSGFFVGPKTIATNHHVVAPANRVEAVLSDQTRLHVVGVVVDDKNADLALLEVDGGPFTPLTLNDGEIVETGESIVVLGSPLGLSGTLSEGIVSAVREEGLPEVLGVDNQAPLLQINAAISPGSSGSPVMNLEGEVIGVAVSQMVAGQNLNFAVPVSKLRDLIGKIEEGKLIKRYSKRPKDLKNKAFPWHNLVISAVFFALLYLGFRKLR